MLQRPMKVQVTTVNGLRKVVATEEMFMHIVPSSGEEMNINGKLFKVVKHVWNFDDSFNGGAKCGYTQTASLTIREVYPSDSLNC